MAASLCRRKLHPRYSPALFFCFKRCLQRHVVLLSKAKEDPNVKIFGWPGSPSKLKEVYVEGEEFRVLVIPGHNKASERDKTGAKKDEQRIPPRYKAMKTDQDWTNVWPNTHMFKWSVVPFPVRQGIPLGKETGGMPNQKYANTELIKIPNFLHLTPAHIKKHCAAIKKFCTLWPEALKTDEDIDKHFPIEVITKEYVRDAPTHRDMRARMVTLKLKMSALGLDCHAKDKLIRLLGHRYNPKTDEIVLNVDRCPLRKQNYDYAQYLLTALFFESWKTEPWEAEKETSDMEKYYWDLMPSRKSLVHTLKTLAKFKNEGNEPGEGVLGVMEDVMESTTEESIIAKDSVQSYKTAVENLHNDGEDVSTLNEYKQSVLKLLLGEKSTEMEKI